eukprot:gnl/MRDRNA2_/MRDRNA2_33618_c0_seq1.p1 gnl/MRDRNA2_/MRDRNA2_33618_c0~~gnl/MRDRNA2_/MRDRNA2_33618_c0_seq1.p1  ORF type:complete len:335 (+),score=33.43 gnl/MRDRNA2_/MRDRNA2_33618_c0_seq1:59-1063(+)
MIHDSCNHGSTSVSSVHDGRTVRRAQIRYLREQCKLSTELEAELSQNELFMNSLRFEIVELDSACSKETRLGSVYHIDDIVVLNKPFDVSIIREYRKYPEELFVTDWFSGYMQGEGNKDSHTTFRPCNRLDFPTSGLMVLARNRHAAAAVSNQFRKRNTVKIYHAIVVGWLNCSEHGAAEDDDFLDIDVPIRKMRWLGDRDRCVPMEPMQQMNQSGPDSSPVDKDQFSDSLKVQSALTRVWPLQRGYMHGFKCTFVKLQMFTGRTHQIRIHMNHIGHPVLGDAMFDKRAGSVFRMFLHAHHLRLTEKDLSWTADSGFAELIEPMDTREALGWQS